MPFFQFGRKLESTKEFSLEEIPIFSSLTPAEQKIVEKKARLIEYKRGDIVYEEGVEPDAFYVVVSGRFRLFNRSSSDHPERNLIFFYRGDHFGEASLLTGRLHSGSVEAKSDGLILRFEKDDFFKLLNDIPSVALHLSRTLGHRLTMSQGGRGPRREVKITAFYSTAFTEKSFILWFDFTLALRRLSKRDVILVDFVPPSSDFLQAKFAGRSIPFLRLAEVEPSRESDVKGSILEHEGGLHYLNVSIEDSDEKHEKKISSLLTFLTYRYDYLLVRLPPDLSHMAFQALKQSDGVYLYCDSSLKSLSDCCGVVAEFEKRFGFSRSEIRVIVPEEKAVLESTFEEKEKLLKHRIFSVIPDQDESLERYEAALSYMAKELAGTLIGLALGSGAAYGLAHIGVLKVLERENIPVDVVSGSSMGALVGGLWAAGYNADELVKIASGIDKKTGFFKLLGFRDVSIAHQGFFKGQQLFKFLAPYLKNKTFHELRVPLRVVATNMFTAEQVIFRAGPVDQAIRASVSIPGIFRPYKMNGQFLIDGGVVDALPVRALSQMGVKKIIAVNVLPGPKDWAERYRLQEEAYKQQQEAEKSRGFWQKMFTSSADRLKKRYSSNIFNAIMNTIQFMEFEMAESWGRKADVLLHPVVQEGHWAQFYYPEKFIKAGEKATEEQLSEIKRLINE